MRTTRRQYETFKAEPLRVENSWRVVGSWGTIEAFRVDKATAEKLAADLNAIPAPHWTTELQEATNGS